MKHVMLDLETWDNTATAVVIQIGACYFDPTTKKIGQKYMQHIHADSEMRAGFTIGASTIDWWMQQSSKAQCAALGNITERKPSFDVWLDFNFFLRHAEHIWSHASFDAAILTYHLSVHNIKPVFSYHALKDLRTLQLLSGIDPKVYKLASDGVLHDALTDATLQADWAGDALVKIGCI